MGPGTSYEVRPESVRAVTSKVANLVSQTAGVVNELSSTVLQGGAFAAIGSPVASANNTLHSQQVNLLQRLTRLLEELNQLVNQATDGYENADRTVADGFGGNNAAADGQATEARAGNQRGEGRYVVYGDDSVNVGGTRSWRNNNPGNLEYGPFARRHGAIGTDGRFAIFPDEATGTAARRALLLGRYGDSTVPDMVPRYAPPHENNVGAYTRAITDQVGVPRDVPINQLSDGQLDSLMTAMRQHEGWRAGQTYTMDNAPDWARSLLEQ